MTPSRSSPLSANGKTNSLTEDQPMPAVPVTHFVAAKKQSKRPAKKTVVVVKKPSKKGTKK